MRYKKVLPLNGEKEARPKKDKLKDLLRILIVFSVVYGIFRVAIHFEFKYIYPIYLVSLTVFLVLFMFFNRGFSADMPTPEMLPDEWDSEKKTEYISGCQKGKARAKKVMIFIFPLILTFLIDAFCLFVLDSLI